MHTWSGEALALKVAKMIQRRQLAKIAFAGLLVAAAAFSNPAAAQTHGWGGHSWGGGSGWSGGGQAHYGYGGGWHGGWGGGWHGGWYGPGWGWYGPGWGWGWGWGLGLGLGAAYWGYPYGYYPYWYDPFPYYPPNETVYVPVPSGTGGPAPTPAGNWYYCDSAKAYYPYVAECPQGWRVVPATPPSH